MTEDRVPSRRVGITRFPPQDLYARPLSAEEIETLRRSMSERLTFDSDVAPFEKDAVVVLRRADIRLPADRDRMLHEALRDPEKGRALLTLPKPSEGSVEWVADQLLRALAASRALSRAGQVDAATREAFYAGRLADHLVLKMDVEAAALRGEKDLGDRQRAARAATREREGRRRDWRPVAQKIFTGLIQKRPERSISSCAQAIAPRVGRAKRTVEDYLRTLR